MLRFLHVLKFTSCILLLTLLLHQGESMGTMPDMDSEQCQMDYQYKVKFNYMWGPDHFMNVPASAHFSKLVVFSHSRRYPAFVEYGVASPGLKEVAETGFTGTIVQELIKAQMMGHVKDYQIGDGTPIGDGTGMDMASVMVNCSFRFISAVSMVAPSLDYIVPLFRLDTMKQKKKKRGNAGDESEQDKDMGDDKMMKMEYRSKFKKKVVAWDAGTKSSMGPTVPQQNIAEVGGMYSNIIARINVQKMKMDDPMDS